MAAWRTKLQRTADPADTTPQSMGSSNDSIEERLRRLKLPKPPPGAKGRGLRRFQEYLDEHPELADGGEGSGDGVGPEPPDASQD